MLFGPSVNDTNIAAVDPTKRRETVAERNEKTMILLSQPRVDKADVRVFDLGRDLVPGHCHRGQKQEIAASHSSNSRHGFPS
jgi:hypothetical protein